MVEVLSVRFHACSMQVVEHTRPTSTRERVGLVAHHPVLHHVPGGLRKSTGVGGVYNTGPMCRGRRVGRCRRAPGPSMVGHLHEPGVQGRVRVLNDIIMVEDGHPKGG